MVPLEVPARAAPDLKAKLLARVRAAGPDATAVRPRPTKVARRRIRRAAGCPDGYECQNGGGGSRNGCGPKSERPACAGRLLPCQPRCSGLRLPAAGLALVLFFQPALERREVFDDCAAPIRDDAGAIAGDGGRANGLASSTRLTSASPFGATTAVGALQADPVHVRIASVGRCAPPWKSYWMRRSPAVRTSTLSPGVVRSG